MERERLRFRFCIPLLLREAPGLSLGPSTKVISSSEPSDAEESALYARSAHNVFHK
jgi:hypothetical protein